MIFSGTVELIKIKIKPINKEFRKNSYDFKLLKLKDGVALFELKKESSVIGYEVHKVRVSLLGNPFSAPSEYTHYHQLPSNEDFGKYGWSFKHLIDAMIKFKEILNDNRSKQKI